MKKLFASKSEPQYESFVGKVYNVSDLTVVVEEVIAEGGFSFVFLVKDTTKQRTYALKRMLVNSQTDLENSKQEIDIMKQFHRHPAMVGFKGHHTKHVGNGIYEILLLMQHCPHGTVVDLMNQYISTGFNETLVRSIFGGIVEAVCLLHHNGYCHRDLKVENILIGANHEFVLCDFGSAFHGDLDPERDGHSIVEENINRFTTVAYRSPEMCDLYLGYKIGKSADNWALGVLLYKLCFFTTPFEENTLAIARAKYTLPTTAANYSHSLISIIHDTLKANPEERLTAKQISSRLKDERPSRKAAVATPAPSAPTVKMQDPTSTAVSAPTQAGTPPERGNGEGMGSNNNRAAIREGMGSNNAAIKPETPSAAIKPRSRPHASKQPLETLISAPPSVTPPQKATKSKKPVVSATTVKQANITAAPATSVKQANITAVPATTAPEEFVAPSGPIGSGVSGATRRKQHTRAVSEGVEKVRLQRHSDNTSPNMAPEDPWGSSASSTSPLVFLPPPPASPATVRGGRRAARGHSRAKSDTTFLKNICNPLSNPFLWEEEKKKCVLSSSTGRLDRAAPGSALARAGSGSALAHSNTNSSERVGEPPGQAGGRLQTTFDSSGWSSIPFEPQPSEDEFLKLSLRDKSNTSTRTEGSIKETIEEQPSKSSKVSRAQTFSHSPRGRPRPVVVKRATIVTQPTSRLQ